MKSEFKTLRIDWNPAIDGSPSQTRCIEWKSVVATENFNQGPHVAAAEEFVRLRTQFWIELFSDLRERHLFNGSHEHKCLLRYVFLGILQRDFDDYRKLWNNHTIRPVRQSLCPSG
ncbi:hypothetical protein E1301_Tti019043 [Triplophysa tibetana]|uniref:Integrase core domain-containing protein n=1 Tax=Triplophysa tibetana TaxID=1572043 RepID=A0A5A9PME3_9TELE|nr:hypothetical protein E1301_Tti019043 [Triplophysa tibetana]